MQDRSDPARNLALGSADPLWSGPTPVLRVGPYRVERMLAAGPDGSHGTVYRASLHDAGAEPLFALKVHRAAASTADAEASAARLERSLRPLYLLDSANLLPLRGHGTVATADGELAYVAFDYEPDIQGLVRYLHRSGAPFAARLAIAIDVAAALQAAHAAGVAHGDLRAARVLVAGAASRNAAGRAQAPSPSVRLSGFEAARLNAWSRAEDAADCSTAGDVLAFGRFLYELFARRPYAGVGAPAPSQLRRELPGALDAIVHKALGTANEPPYADMQALRADLERLRAAPPAPAWMRRTASAIRRRPLRAAAVFLLGSVGILVGRDAIRSARVEQNGVRGELAQARTALAELSAARAREAAAAAELGTTLDAARSEQSELEARTQRAETLAALFERQLTELPVPNGDPVSGSALLDELAGRVERDVDRSGDAAAVHRVLGRSYLRLGELERAEAQLQLALDLEDELERAAGGAATRVALAGLHRRGGRLAAARELANDALGLLRGSAAPSRLEDPAAASLELARIEFAEQHFSAALDAAQASADQARDRTAALSAGALSVRALVELGRLDEAIDLGLGLAAHADAQPPAADRDGERTLARADLAAELGRAYALTQELALAGPLLRETLALTAAQLGAEHPLTSERGAALAAWLQRRGDHAAAAELWRSVAAERSARLGASDGSTLEAQTRRAQALFAAEDWDAAGAAFERCVPLCREALGMDHPLTVEALRDYGRVLARKGSPEQSERFLRAALQGEARLAEAAAPVPASASPAPAAEPAQTTLELAQLLRSRGDAAEAVELLEQALASARTPALRIDLRTELAAAYAERGALDAATTELLDVVQEQRAHLGEDHPGTLHTELRLAQILRQTGDADGALHWTRHAVSGLATLDAASADLDTARLALAQLLLESGRTAEATGALRPLVEAWTETLGAAHPTTLGAVQQLAAALLAEGAAGEARALLEPALAALAPAPARESTDPAELERLRQELNSLLGRSLVALGRYPEAEQALLAVVQQWDEAGDANAEDPPRSTYRALAELYEALEQPALAQAYRARSDR